MIEDRFQSSKLLDLLEVEKPLIIKVKVAIGGLLRVRVMDHQVSPLGHQQQFTTVAKGSTLYTPGEVGHKRRIELIAVTANLLPATVTHYSLEYNNKESVPELLDLPLVISEGVIPYLTVVIDPR